MKKYILEVKYFDGSKRLMHAWKNMFDTLEEWCYEHRVKDIDVIEYGSGKTVRDWLIRGETELKRG